MNKFVEAEGGLLCRIVITARRLLVTFSVSTCDEWISGGFSPSTSINQIGSDGKILIDLCSKLITSCDEKGRDGGG